MRKHWPLIVSICCVFTCATIFTIVQFTSNRSPDHTVYWNLYHGNLASNENDYRVEIDESLDSDGRFIRLVHLYPAGKESWVGITGHDYNNDGQWDRVFYCGYQTTSDGHASGCDSVIRTDQGWEWDPCPADEGRVEPFLTSEIVFAVQELDKAIVAIHNQAHMTERWQWDSSKKACVRVYGQKQQIPESLPAS